MKKTVLIFGLLSGLIFVIEMSVVLPLVNRGVIKMESSLLIGYTTMVLSFLLVFFGVRAHRDNSGGTITFGKAFKVGLLITLVSCAIYVVSWEIIYFKVTPDFWEKYSEQTLQQMRAKGEPETAVAAKRKEMQEFKPLLDNVFINSAFTFIEPFPVGLLMTLISAAILRRKSTPPAAATAAAIA